MKAPLRAHLLLLVVALVIPLAGLLGMGAWRDAQDAVAQARAVHRPLSTLVASDVGRTLQTAQQTLELVARRPAVRTMDSTLCDPLLTDLLYLGAGYSNLVTTNLQGDVVCSALALPPGKNVNVGTTPWFQRALRSGQFSVGDAHTGPISGKWVTVVSLPIHDPTGARVGLAHLTLDLAVLNPSLPDDSLPADTRYGVFDTQGALLWRNRDPEKAIGTHPDWEVARRIMAKEKEFEAEGLDGIRRFYYTAPIPEAGWIAYFGQPSSGIYAQAKHRAWVSAVVALLIVLVLCLVALVQARRIERPIRSLAQAMQRHRMGDSSARAEPSGPAELAQLALDFNRLLTERADAETTLHAQHRALQEAKDRADHAMQITQMGLWTWDISTGTLYADDMLARLFGYEPAELRATPILQWRERTDPQDLPILDERLRACLKGESAQLQIDQRIRHRQGHWIWGQWRGRVTERDAQGRAQVMMGSFIDVTERMKEREQLQLAASVFTYAREGITITDTRGTIIDVNDTFTRITGYTREEAVGNNPRMLQSGRQGPEFYAAMWQSLLTHGHWTGEVWNRRKSGELFAEIITISAVRNAKGETQHYVALFTDITTLKENERKLEHVAHYDALTGLPNRVLLADRLQQSMLRCQRKGLSLAVAFLDLDGFKAINDRHSHDLGDKLLVALAYRLKASLREGDTLSRIGGDEFVAVLVDLEQPQDCEPVLSRMLQAAADPVQVDEHLLQVSGSIGVTIYPTDGVEPDLLIRHADQAMYQAKQAGKNRFHLFDVAHDKAVKTQREEVARIRQGLQAGEFVLHYQPKVNMRSGAVIGAEALIRWQHPERGLLAPAAFLPTIENHPICIDVGEWVIASALRQMAEWKAQGLSLPVSVNIDAMQLQKEGFSQRLAQLLDQQPQVPPRWLCLEILETNALDDIALVSDIMRRCQALGVRFALDDFGTGYSSLTYLKRLGAEEIKIDQSFVRDMLVDLDDLAIVQGVIGLAQAFHRDVIAEGVETTEHGARLLPLGCHLAQGYGIARPMPAQDVARWAAQWEIHPPWSIRQTQPPDQ
ncbi:MAG: EAL domain-containing protein [Burkholderiales bacterium]|nr:EAL domain-containing protein [Burkholderiales bacterium]